MHYSGQELETFAFADNWKRYWSSMVSPYTTGVVAEVGAGIGSNTLLMVTDRTVEWLCVEPDPALASRCESTLGANDSAASISVVNSDFRSLPTDQRFDAIVYIDVLEHIERDDLELEYAYERLNPRGHIVVLAPAHEHLFSEMDERVGHFRRYTLKTLRKVRPAKVREVRGRYLDAVGYFASLTNRWLLKQEAASLSQVRFWDSWIVPVSRILDRVLAFRFGKSVLIIWQRD